MVVKVYISGISGNKEVKKRQQRVLMILDSKNIKYELIDITEPGREADKDFMQNNSKSNGGTVSDPNPRSPLPPQIFNDEEYCGDYDQFDLANEVDTLEVFLKVETPPEEPVDDKATINGVVTVNAETESKESSHEEKVNSTEEQPQTNEVTTDNGTVDSVAKEGSVEKEVAEETSTRQKSVEKEQSVDKTEESTEKSKIVTEEIVKEKTPAEDEAINENGAVSSREQSEEKEEHVNEQKKESPSEALLQSEQSAATD